MRYFTSNEVVPVFPLPDCVLFPTVKMPLHIFEARYSQMIDYVIDRKGIFCMATLVGEWKTQYHASPRFAPMGCMARVLDYDKLPDARYNVLVEGIARVWMTEKHSDRLYRMVAVEEVKDHHDLKRSLHVHHELKKLARRAVRMRVEDAVQPHFDDLIKSMSLSELVHIMSFYAPVDIDRKLRMLEENSFSVICEMLLESYRIFIE